MENPEELLQLLDEFTKLKPKDIPKELEEYLSYVAKTGDPVYQWSLVKCLFREKLLNVITDFFETCPTIELPPCPNVDPFNYELMKNSLVERIESFPSAPFTIQRLCELLTSPRKEYSRVDKFMRAIEKNILVVSTREPGYNRTSDSITSQEILVNGVMDVRPLELGEAIETVTPDGVNLMHGHDHDQNSISVECSTNHEIDMETTEESRSTETNFLTMDDSDDCLCESKATSEAEVAISTLEALNANEQIHISPDSASDSSPPHTETDICSSEDILMTNEKSSENEEEEPLEEKNAIADSSSEVEDLVSERIAFYENLSENDQNQNSKQETKKVEPDSQEKPEEEEVEEEVEEPTQTETNPEQKVVEVEEKVESESEIINNSIEETENITSTEKETQSEETSSNEEEIQETPLENVVFESTNLETSLLEAPVVTPTESQLQELPPPILEEVNEQEESEPMSIDKDSNEDSFKINEESQSELLERETTQNESEELSPNETMEVADQTNQS